MPVRGSQIAWHRTPGGKAHRKQRAQAFIMQTHNQDIRGPWLGYVPDIDPAQLPPNAAKDCLSLVAKGEILVPDDGFSRVDSARLPVGDEGDGGTAGNIALPVGAGEYAQPIVGIGQIYVQDPALGGSTPVIAAFAITSQRSGAGVGETGHFIAVNGAGNWVEVPYAAGVNEIDGTRNDLFDHCVAPFGGTSSGAPNPAPGAVIFCNGVDRVYVWDLNDAVTGFPGDINELPPGPFSTFRAESCENFGERIVFLNTEEDGEKKYQRVRWTAIGNVGTGALSDVGAGALDLYEFSEPGMRILKLGNVLACYFRDGVAFLRRTNVSSSPFKREYRTSLRGIVSKFAVTSIGRDAHFGVFTDGWYLLDSNGNWRELGLMDVGGVPTYKWKREFYKILDYDNLSKVCCSYDPVNKFVRVAFPTNTDGSGENTQVWTYDLLADRIWKDEYEVTCWGLYNQLLQAGEQWDEATGTWETDTGTWEDLRPRVGFLAATHGTSAGVVLQHNSDIFTQDGAVPTWRYESHPHPFGSPRLMKVADRVWLEYERLESPENISVEILNREGQGFAQTIRPSETDEGLSMPSLRSQSTSFRVASTHIGFRLSGRHPQRIHSVDLQLEISAAEDNKDYAE